MFKTIRFINKDLHTYKDDFNHNNINNNFIYNYKIHPKIGMFLKGEFFPNISPLPTDSKEPPRFVYNPSPFVLFPE